MKMYLETDRMIFRELELADEQSLLELDSDPEVMKFLTNGKASSREEVQSSLKRILEIYDTYQHRFGFWAAIEKRSGQFMGWFHFRPAKADPSNVKRIELGYRLKRSFWGHGYATEGSRALVQNGFRELGVDEVFAITMEANLGSRRVMEKSGLNFSRAFFNPDFPGTEEKDVEYSISRSAWNLTAPNACSGQSWIGCAPTIRKTVEDIASTSKEILGGSLVSVILHGSLAMGSYYFPKSDIDILIIVDGPLSNSIKQIYFDALARIADQRACIGDIELSVILRAALDSQEKAVPYELHYSQEIRDSLASYDFEISRSDYDLPAHFMVAFHRGIAIWGPSFSDLVQEPSWDGFRSAVKEDLEWILTGENILSTPFYSILNCCRAYRLLLKGENVVESKEEGALRALEDLNGVRPVIEKALEAYRSNKVVTIHTRRTNGEEWDKEELLDFRNQMRVLFAPLSISSIN